LLSFGGYQQKLFSKKCTPCSAKFKRTAGFVLKIGERRD
jgi:hypothetical protein